MSFTFCPLYSGSSGNALYVSGGDTRLLIDAGVTVKALVTALNTLSVLPDSLSGILITHEHSDHIRGVGPLSRKFNLPIYASQGTWNAMADKLGGIEPRNKRVFAPGEDFYIGAVNVAPFAIPHDAAEPVGFALHHGGHKIATATDLGHIHPSWMSAVSGAELLMLEANHDLAMLDRGHYPYYLKKRIRSNRGHLSNDDCAKALCKLVKSGVRRCVLGHLSQENNLPELAYETVACALSLEGIHCGEDFQLDMAFRDKPGMFYTIA